MFCLVCRPPAESLPGEVFITQFTSANLSMPNLNLHVAQTASWFGANGSMVSNITVTPLDGADSVDAIIHVRMPGCAACLSDAWHDDLLYSERAVNPARPGSGHGRVHCTAAAWV